MIRFTGPDLKLHARGVYDWYANAQVEVLDGGRYLAQLYPRTGLDRGALAGLGCPRDGLHTYLCDAATGAVAPLFPPDWSCTHAVRHKDTGRVYVPAAVDSWDQPTRYFLVPDGDELVPAAAEPWKADYPFRGGGHTHRRRRVGDVGLLSGLDFHGNNLGSEDLKFLLPQLGRVANDDVVVVRYRDADPPGYTVMSLKSRNAVVAVAVAPDGLTAVALLASEWAPFEVVAWDLE